jgi:hypothetical protein
MIVFTASCSGFITTIHMCCTYQRLKHISQRLGAGHFPQMARDRLRLTIGTAPAWTATTGRYD